MKHIGLLISLLFFSQQLFAQNMGNAKYRSRTNDYNYRYNQTEKNRNLPIKLQRDGSITLTIKGLSNVKADAYVAVFNVKQMGTTAQEVNQLLDNRIQQVKAFVNAQTNLEMHEDMISFVPTYEYDVEKKVFSKKTYNEVPKGFELQKNLHIKYTNPDMLKQLIAICAEAEIYDLVKVDYYSTKLEDKKKELEEAVRKAVIAKKDSFVKDFTYDLSLYDKDIADAFDIIYPVEQYQSYKAYSSTSLNLTKSSKVNTAQKTASYYFDPLKNKFDVVINPIMVEPAIQVIYEIQLRFRPQPKKSATGKIEYMLITPTGELKKLQLGQ